MLFLCVTASHIPAARSESAVACCNVVELRQYTLHPGTQKAFTALFEGTFTEPQEATGMTVIGEFEDLDRPNHFVWMRGFQDMVARVTELDRFYQGEVWHAHRDEANGSIEDSGNVLLLQTTSATFGLDNLPARPPLGSDPSPAGLVVVTLYYTAANDARRFGSEFERTFPDLAATQGARTLAVYVTSMEPNNYPRLPVRSGEAIVVWIAGFANATAYVNFETKIAKSEHWIARWNAARAQLSRDPEVLRLVPTAGSRLRG
jgi:hypothetical protein